MKYHPPHTVDISAESLKPFEPPVEPAQSLPLRSAIAQSLGVDLGLLFLSLMAGILFSGAIAGIDVSNVPNAALLKPPIWLIFLACAFPALLWLIMDGLSVLSNPALLPFARSKPAMKAMYAKRLHLLLLAFYFTAILVALCWSAFSMLLVSKLFVSAVFAVALYALGRSIPSRRLSFAVSGVLFVVVLVTTQAFVLLRLEADSSPATQDAPDELELFERGRDSPFDDEE